jgi:hypothetical protein
VLLKVTLFLGGFLKNEIRKEEEVVGLDEV